MKRGKIGKLTPKEKRILGFFKETGKGVGLSRFKKDFDYDISSELESLKDGRMIKINRKTSRGINIATVSITKKGTEAVFAN